MSGQPQESYVRNGHLRKKNPDSASLRSATRVCFAFWVQFPVRTQFLCWMWCRGHGTRRGTHDLSCRKSAGRHSRHSEANGLIRRACASAGVPALLEPPGLSRSDGKRPDGITWSMEPGSAAGMGFHVLCGDTLVNSNIASSSSEAGKVAAEAERIKTAKYEDLSRTHLFAPVWIQVGHVVLYFDLFWSKKVSFCVCLASLGHVLYFGFNAFNMLCSNLEQRCEGFSSASTALGHAI